MVIYEQISKKEKIKVDKYPIIEAMKTNLKSYYISIPAKKW